MTGPRPLLQRAAGWRARFDPLLTPRSPEGKHPLILAAFLIFLAAFGVRLLHWVDNSLDIERRDSARTGLEARYRRDAQRIIDEKSILFTANPDPGDARLIVHPPGYPILIAALANFHAAEDQHSFLRLAQIGLDSMAAVLILLITGRFFPLAVASIAGLIVAFSPHLAYYSLSLTPESIAVVPVIVAVYLIMRGLEWPGLLPPVAAGIAVGVSCWLRSNALLLGPFLSIVIFLLYERRDRLRCAGTLLLATLVTIAPITIRNYLVYHRFIPLSVGAGITMIEGIADYDTENRFGLPADDEQSALKDAEWYNRPDYAANLWMPDGPQRDSWRLSRGLSVIEANPGWFFGVMLRRAGFMLRYNDSGPMRWPLNTALAPIVSSQPGFSHYTSLKSSREASLPQWSSSAAELAATGSRVSQGTISSMTLNGEKLQITSDDNAYGDQFYSEPISVEKDNDYLFRIDLSCERGTVAVKVTSGDRHITLASYSVSRLAAPADRQRKQSTRAARSNEEADSDKAGDEKRGTSFVEIPFASNERADVRLVFSNNGTPGSVTNVGQGLLYRIGPTEYLWTRPLRFAVRTVQRNTYRTGRMLILIAIGIFLVWFSRSNRALLCLLVVPAYYLAVQSAFHTEYRYVLAIHYFLFIFTAVAIYSAGKLFSTALQSIIASIKRRPGMGG